MTANNAQIELIKKARRGDFGLPTSYNELAELMSDAVLARDYETEEALLMQKCKSQFIRTVQQKSNGDGWIYLSVVKNVLASRSYFKDFDKRLKLRGIDSARYIATSMIIDGLIKKNGLEVMITNKALNFDNEF